MSIPWPPRRAIRLTDLDRRMLERQHIRWEQEDPDTVTLKVVDVQAMHGSMIESHNAYCRMAHQRDRWYRSWQLAMTGMLVLAAAWMFELAWWWLQ